VTQFSIHLQRQTPEVHPADKVVFGTPTPARQVVFHATNPPNTKLPPPPTPLMPLMPLMPLVPSHPDAPERASLFSCFLAFLFLFVFLAATPSVYTKNHKI
jgi:hypothetical protein